MDLVWILRKTPVKKGTEKSSIFLFGDFSMCKYEVIFCGMRVKTVESQQKEKASLHQVGRGCNSLTIRFTFTAKAVKYICSCMAASPTESAL